MATDSRASGAEATALPTRGDAVVDGSLQGQRQRTRGSSRRPPGSSRRRPPRRKRKVRRVHRVVHHLEVWSVLKLSVLFGACAYLVGLTSGYLLWRAADRVGTIDGIEGFFEDAGGYDRFEILGDVVFRASAIIGLVLAGVAVFTAVLGAVLFNLISDLTGGIRMTVIDEDLVVAPVRRPRPPGPATEVGADVRAEPAPPAPAERSSPDAAPIVRQGSAPPPSEAERDRTISGDTGAREVVGEVSGYNPFDRSRRVSDPR